LINYTSVTLLVLKNAVINRKVLQSPAKSSPDIYAATMSSWQLKFLAANMANLQVLYLWLTGDLFVGKLFAKTQPTPPSIPVDE